MLHLEEVPMSTQQTGSQGIPQSMPVGSAGLGLVDVSAGRRSNSQPPTLGARQSSAQAGASQSGGLRGGILTARSDDRRTLTASLVSGPVPMLRVRRGVSSVGTHVSLRTYGVWRHVPPYGPATLVRV